MLKGKNTNYDLKSSSDGQLSGFPQSSKVWKSGRINDFKYSFLKRFSLLLLLLSLYSFNTKGQAAGDYGAVVSGSWATASIWKIYNGTSWASSPVAGSSPNNSATNVWITTGITVTYPASLIACNNITVMSTAKLFSNTSVSNKYLYVYGNITCDGTIGNGATFDDISLSIEGANCLFTGAGTVDVSRIRKNTAANTVTNFIIDINITIRFGAGSQTQIYNATGGTDFNVTVNAGKTVNVTGGAFVGNVCIDGLDGTNGTDCGGTFTINGTLLISGTLYLTTDNGSRPCTFIIGPTGIVSTAYVVGNASGAAQHTLTMNAGSLLQISVSGSAAAQFLFTTNNNYNLAAGSTIEYKGTAAQYVESAITYANLRISGTSTKTAIGVLNIAGNLDIITPVGTVLAPYPSNPIINIGGNWTSYGSAGFLETPSTVVFNGSGNQTITVTGGEIFYNIRMNKTGGQAILANTVASPTIVTNNADFLSGNILACAMGGSYYLRILNTATVTNASDASFVDGLVGREAIAASPIVNFVYPVGKSGRYRPAAINGTPTLGHTMFCEFTLGDGVAVYGAAKAATLDHVSRCEYWRIRQQGAGATAQLYTVTLSWPTYQNCMVVNSLTDLRVTSWTSPTASLWNDLGNGGTTGTTAAGTIVTTGNFSFVGTALGTPFTLASVLPTNPLPVELISFNAKARENKVYLDWATATEINNDYFTIERSDDGKNFYPLLFVDGSGTTTQSQEYAAIDEKPLNGVSYYRLRQTDFDGKTSISSPVAVRFDETFDKLTVYPNPAINTIRLLTPQTHFEKCMIQIITTEGKVVKSFMVASNEDVEIEVSDLPQGVYNVELSNESTKYHSLFVKQ